MPTDKNVLLICWDFPPNYGIGGRRWAKFAKCLLNDGYTIYVIKSETPKGNITSPWLKDVTHKNLFTNSIKPHWAVEWLHSYDGLLSSAKIRFAQLYLKLLYKGTVFDKAIGIQDEFIALTTEQIKRFNITNVIVTGAPFNLLYYTSLLKEKFEDLNIIADYRDPWLNSVNYGIRELGIKQLKEEQAKQDFVLKHVDVVTSPNDFLMEQIKQTYKGDIGKSGLPSFVTLPHVFDADDVEQIKVEKDSTVFKLIYAGALYSDTERYLKLLASSIMKFKSEFPGIKIKVDLYTKHRSRALAIPGLEDTISFHEPIGDNIFKIVNDNDLFIILLSDHNKDFKTTKFYEFLPYKVPYLMVGPSGHVSESIEKEKLGFLLTDENHLGMIYKKLLLQQELEGFRDIEKYSLNNSISLLNSILKN